MGAPLPAWRIIAGLSSGVDVDDRQVLALLAAGPLSSVQLAQALAQPVPAVDARMAGLHAAGVALQHDGSHWQLQQLPDLHDEGRIRQALAVHVSRSLAGLEVLWQVDSTNSELLRRPPVADGFQVLLAEQQSAGRGRRGRQWVSPLARHVYLSLACRFEQGIAAMAGLSLAVGVLVAEALRDAGVAGAGLKWPNDVLINGQKLAGILVESRGRAQGPARAVVGIGLNVHGADGAQAGIDQPWTALDAHRPDPLQRDAVVALLLNALLPGLQQFQQHGLAAFSARFAAVDLLAGQDIWINESGQQRPARAIGLAADGALRVVDRAGEHCLHAGDVSVRKQ